MPYNSSLSHWKTLLDYLASLLNPDMSVTIPADREFGDVERLRYVSNKGWFSPSL